MLSGNSIYGHPLVRTIKSWSDSARVMAVFIGSVIVYSYFISAWYWNGDVPFNFSADGLHDWGILLVIPLNFKKASTVSYGTTFLLDFIQKKNKIKIVAAFWARRFHKTWLFYLHSMVEIRPFSPIFPLVGFMAEALYWLSFGSFKK